VPVVHFQLQVATANEKVTVSAAPAVVATDSFTPTTLVSGQDIERTPGADGTNSMAMITDYVPGAYVTHDMLHMRGGHQITWLLDGIPVINTAIAQNLGPQFDPKDLDYVEVNRGSYGAEFGDRTYGVFNVVPRTGFERNNEAELVLTAGNFYQTDDELSFGSHTDRFAYYASVNGNRSNLGLQPPVPQVVHDAVNGVGGFGNFIFNVDPSNQLRLMTSVRRDYYPDPLRSQSQRHRKLNPQRLPQHRPSRCPNRGRYRRPLHLAAHFQFPSPDHGLALLPLQQRRLRQQSQRHSHRHHGRTAPPPTPGARPASPPTTRRTICRLDSSASTSTITRSSEPSSTTAAEIRPSPSARAPPPISRPFTSTTNSIPFPG
jgi:hypothetical protein